VTARVRLAADAHLPHRDVMLDPEAAATRLAPLVGLSGGAVRAERLRAKYRVGQSLRVLHRLHSGGETRLVSTRMAPPERAARLAAGSGATVSTPADVVFDAELDCVSWTFPRDRKIASLGALLEPGPDLRLRLGARRLSSTLVAYAPEKAATARLDDGDGEAVGYAKTYADAADLSAALARNELIAGTRSTAWLRIPRVLEVLPDQNLMVLEPLRGRRLDGLASADLGAALERLAAALACLHLLPAPMEEEATRTSRDSLERAAEHVAIARPDVSGLVDRVLEALTERPPFTGSTMLHGDVHLKNAVIDGDRLGLLDLDQLTAGHPGADVGSLLAALRCAVLTGTLATEHAAGLASRFLTAYRQHAPLDAQAVRWHTAAALLGERALRAVNRVLPRTLEVLPMLLHEALHLMAYDATDDLAVQRSTAVPR
jgi:aminoglycoside phosphotransferase